MTGSSSRIAAASRPKASAGPAGEAILRPGTHMAQFSTDWPCWLPKPSPPEPLAPRSTSGTVSWPPVMYRSFGISLATWSQQVA